MHLSRTAHRSGGVRRAVSVTAVLVSCALVAAACGARVPPYLGSGGSGGAALGANGGTGTTVPNSALGSTGPSGGTTGPSGGTTGSGGSTGSTGGTKGNGSAPSVPTGFNFTPQTEAAACPGSTGNTASAPGITPTSITLGNVSGLTGPLSGSFPQGPQAVQALFAAVDSAGGVCGRKLNLVVEDDGQDTSTNKSDTDDLIAKPVFGFVGSVSDADNGGVPDIQAAHLPDFGFAINCDRAESPDYWSVAGGSCYQPQGPNGKYYIGDGTFALAQSQGYLPKSMAFLAYSIAISATAAQQFEYVYTHYFGGTACYQDYSISPVSASLESDVQQMRSNNCQGVFDTLDVTGNAKLLQAIQQQQFSMPYVAATFDAYTPVMIQTAGESAAQGLKVALPFTPLDENTPMTDMYQQQLSQFEPGDQPSGFGFLSWLAGQMFIYTLLQAGRNPTEASLLTALNGLKDFTANGAVGAYSPSEHSVAPCTMDVQVSGNNFVRKAPSSGFYCGGQTVQAQP
ncbi:MAG: ABC transporter substrate-binding protein [Acidimicrobiales bacterium]